MADPIGPYADFPPDLLAEAEELERRKRITSGRMRLPFGPSIYRDQAQAEMRQSQDLQNRYNQGLQEALRQYESTRQGTLTVPNSSMGFEEVRQGADPRKAAIDAIMSRYPVLNRLGASDMKFERELDKPVELDPDKLLVFPGGQRPNVQGLPGKSKEVPANWREYLPEGAKQGPIAGQYYVEAPNGPDLYQLEFERGKLVGSKKLDNAPRINIDNRAESAGATEFGKRQAHVLERDLIDRKAKATAAADDIEVIKQAMPYYNAGIKTGSFQMARNEIDKFLQTIGIKSNDPRISNTDVWARTMAKRVVALLGTRALGAGTGISDADRRFMEMVASGQNLDDRGLKEFFRIAMAANTLELDKFYRHLENIQKMPGSIPGFAEAYTVPVPDFGPEGMTIGGPPKASQFGGRPKE